MGYGDISAPFGLTNKLSVQTSSEAKEEGGQRPLPGSAPMLYLTISPQFNNSETGVRKASGEKKRGKGEKRGAETLKESKGREKQQEKCLNCL